MLQFSNITEQARNLLKADSIQWPTANIVASCNNYLDTLTGYAIGADYRYNWGNTQHTALPDGKIDLVANQSDYSWATDEQGNSIITLLRVEILGTDGIYRQLENIHLDEIEGSIDEYEKTAGIPAQYLKLTDNILRLFPKPKTSVTGGLRLYFQRTSPYFVVADTTKTTGFSPLLDRGFVIASALDGAGTLVLANLNWLQGQMQLEQAKMIQYFSDRNEDEPLLNVSGEYINSI